MPKGDIDYRCLQIVRWLEEVEETLAAIDKPLSLQAKIEVLLDLPPNHLGNTETTPCVLVKREMIQIVGWVVHARFRSRSMGQSVSFCFHWLDVRR
jgi:hypothetical protein